MDFNEFIEAIHGARIEFYGTFMTNRDAYCSFLEMIDGAPFPKGGIQLLIAI